MLRGEARGGVTSDTLRREEMRGSRGVVAVWLSRWSDAKIRQTMRTRVS
jgi:hypothetical protein